MLSGPATMLSSSVVAPSFIHKRCLSPELHYQTWRMIACSMDQLLSASMDRLSRLFYCTFSSSNGFKCLRMRLPSAVRQTRDLTSCLWGEYYGVLNIHHSPNSVIWKLFLDVTLLGLCTFWNNVRLLTCSLSNFLFGSGDLDPGLHSNFN